MSLLANSGIENVVAAERLDRGPGWLPALSKPHTRFETGRQVNPPAVNMPAESSMQEEAAAFNPATTSEEAIRDHVEKVIRRTYDYINGAALEYDLIAYHISPSGIETTVPGGQRRLRMMSQSEFMQGISWLHTEYPGFHIEVESMDLIVHKEHVVRKTSGLVEVWANCATSGGPGYIESIKRYVNVFEFRFEAGRWVCTKEAVVDGMSGGS